MGIFILVCVICFIIFAIGLPMFDNSSSNNRYAFPGIMLVAPLIVFPVVLWLAVFLSQHVNIH